MLKKNCLHCNKEFSVSFQYEFKKRKFCSPGCSNKFYKENNAKAKIGPNNPMWKHGLYAVAKSKGSIRKILPVQCERCGSEKGLVAHHKNRNREDNRVENLEIICRSCHAKEHEFYKTIINLKRDKYGRKLPKERK